MNFFRLVFLMFALLFISCNSTVVTEESVELNGNIPEGSLTRLLVKSEYIEDHIVDVWLPEDYPNGGPYDVLYMNDGGSLYGLAKGHYNNIEWRVDETVSELVERGAIPPSIVVGIHNTGRNRTSEYFPQKAVKNIDKEEFTGFMVNVADSARADNYLKFIVKALKPYIDKNFNVKSDKDHTFILGSSMGGLISMYAKCEYPDVFKGAGCLSSHFVGRMEANDAIPNGILKYMEENLPTPTADNIFYFNYGDVELDSLYAPYQKRVDSLMVAKGYNSDNWQTHFYPGESHSQPSWAKNLDVALRFIMGDVEKPKGEGNTYYLYYMGGQSNMEGFGFTKELPAEYNYVHKDVMIFTGTLSPDRDTVYAAKGSWDYLRPGHGLGYNSNGVQNNYSNRFGPELPFGVQISKLNPDKKIAIVKYARGGTSLSDVSGWGNWMLECDYVNQYDHFLKTLENAFKSRDIDGDGIDDKLIPAGILWMQGESDSEDLASAKNYEKNLTALMNSMRKALGDENLPIVIAKISDSKKGGKKLLTYDYIVHKAQEDFVKKDSNAACIDNPLGYSFLSDGYHYTTKDYIDLGCAFADAINKLEYNK